MGEGEDGAPAIGGPQRVESVFEGAMVRLEVEHWPGDSRREVVRHPGACAGVVVVGDRVVLIRQVREPIRRRLVEIPAGVYDRPGESPEDAMRREVEEETGYRVVDLERLATVFSSPGFTDERVDLFLVRAERTEDGPEEGIEASEVPLEEAARMATAGEVQDAKSALALLLVRDRLRPA